MRKQWENWLKESIIIYSIIYTITTIVSSALYLFLGIRDDPSGNWHEITRALIVLIGVFAYELAKHLPIKNVVLRTLVVYVVTLGCAFLSFGQLSLLNHLQKVPIKIFL